MRQTTGGGPTLGQSSRTIRGDMGAVDETLTAEAAGQAIIRTEGLTKVYAGADFTAVDRPRSQRRRRGRSSACSVRTVLERPPRPGC